jgi:hypothetical protein
MEGNPVNKQRIIATAVAAVMWFLMIAAAAVLSGCASAPPVPTTCNISLDGKCLDCEPIPSAWGMASSEAWKGRNGP